MDPKKAVAVSYTHLVEHDSAALGDIVAVTGIPGLNIGETACAPDCVEPLPFVNIDEPTISMVFMVNNSPFCLLYTSR